MYGLVLGINKVNEFDSISLMAVIFCMVSARNAAMGFNRYLDRNIDKENERTKNREIPSGLISPKSALLFVILNCLVFISSTLLLNKLVFFLSPIALLVILGYSYTKRFTFLCHLILGLGLALAPTGAYLAATAEFDLQIILVSLGVLFWVSGFDIIYALQDIEFDKSQKLFSIPVLLGIRKSLILSSIFHSVSFLLIAFSAVFYTHHILFYIGLTIFGILLFYQHIIIKVNDLSRINLAFFTTNGVASVVFGVFAILDVLVLSC